MTDTAVLERTETPLEPKTLRGEYGKLAEEYRDLLRHQFENGLKTGEVQRRDQLEEMGKAGLFNPDLTEAQLERLGQRHQAEVTTGTHQIGDLKELATEYRQLGVALVEHGLNAGQLVRFNYLDGLRKKRLFQQLA